MLDRIVTSALNHILAGEAWARERLRNFSGQHLRLAGGPIHLDLTVDGEGFFRRADVASGACPAVIIDLPPDAPFRLLHGGRESVFAAARLTGAADFAETLAFVFRNLRWDPEDDLSKVFGDIAAHRMATSGAAMLGGLQRGSANLAANAAEFLSEEAALITPAMEVRQFNAEVRALQEDLERLERRLARL